jgi:hypothetical protein
MAAKKAKRTSETTPPPPPSLEQQRKQFVSAKVAQGVSREAAKQQFYVQTRAKELAAQGKEVTPAVRAQLRQNWQSGKVTREGFGAPKKPMTNTATKPVTNTSTKPVVNNAPKPEPKKNTNATPSTRVQSSPDRMPSPRRNQTMVDRMPLPGRSTSGVSADRYPSPPRSQGGSYRFGVPVFGRTAASRQFEKDRAAYEKQMAAMKRMRGKK